MSNKKEVTLVFVYQKNKIKRKSLEAIGKVSGIPIVKLNDYYELDKATKVIPIIYGIHGESSMLLSSLFVSGKSFIYMDNAALRKGFQVPKSDYHIIYRIICYLGLRVKYIQNYDLTPKAFRLNYKSLNYKINLSKEQLDLKVADLNVDSHILIIPPSNTMAQLLNKECWLDEIIFNIRKVTNRKIIVRGKPNQHILRKVNFQKKGLLPNYTYSRLRKIKNIIFGVNNNKLVLRSKSENTYNSIGRNLQKDFANCAIMVNFNSSLFLNAIDKKIPIMSTEYSPLADVCPIDINAFARDQFIYINNYKIVENQVLQEEFLYNELRGKSIWSGLINRVIDK
jgi:hypothetical protein